MAKIKADGDRWKVRLGRDSRRPGLRPVLFFCETTDQRPYRVVEVPEDRFCAQADVDALSSGELRELFDRSTSLDAPRLRSDEVQDVRRAAAEGERPSAP